MRLISVALLALMAAAPVWAEVKGDPAAGKVKAYTCTGCHGITGYRNVYPHFHVPRIAGQNYEYLVAALKAYEAGTRKHSTMVAQAQSLSEQDIADIAAYLANTTNP